ncbi:spore germination protein [Rossellomorea marisflavi]|uniref:Stage V sporulation protein AF n=1 Tax=Rossellomorea marisflavi TaxID=189381 RepID=A0A0J5VVY4_9BACI|nr:spore germination protein [Rossellomorea marisflavi]KMK93652.1 stage V sporulation protein AF [Rossellomorea marisflavi]KML01410.1 stage V sporulation protein AF [Rossellomorea marisflavi]KML34836.1 stage V sporulation protein AF [Rossellomorea marisflavi]KZE45653.1 stage V sporulation protein AF [Rossellomorea marisflavi]QHA36785.1 spore germination protein [Rossellomorea marisflavi]
MGEIRKTPIPKDLGKLEEYMQNHVGLNKSFDLGVRKLMILKKGVHIYYINGLTDASYVIHIVEELVDVNDNERATSKIYDIVHNRLVHQSVEPVKTVEEAVDEVLSGLIAVFVEGAPEALIVDVRSYPGRQPSEPDTEKVVRGSRDGYVENIIVNTALTRRRIRDPRLRFEIFRIGERSKTDISIAYIEDVADPNLIEIVKQELQSIKIDGLTMADKTIEEFLVKQGYNPYPLVRYTERADVGATHLLEGHVLIFVDTSPSVIITPTTYFHHLQHAEEYRQSPAVGTFVRWTRFLGVLASLFLLPLWYLFVLDPSLLPEAIKYVGPDEQTNIPVIAQLFIADLGVEMFRIAAIHTPTPLSTAMGLIAAVLIGQIAIDVGLFQPEVILYVAVASIGTFATPSYELSVANKMARLIILIFVALFHIPGLVIGCTLYVLFVTNIKSLNTPYMWPLLPFSPKAFLQILIRRSVPGAKIRPSIVHAKNRHKQPS